MKVRLFHGSFHDVDSDALSFELAARIGFKEAAKKAKPQLLEPIMSVEVISPDEYTGPITGDLNRRRGLMKGMDTKGTASVIKANVPLLSIPFIIPLLLFRSPDRSGILIWRNH